MNERSSNQDTSTKVLAEEEDLGGNLHPLDLLRNHRKSSTSYGGGEDNDYTTISLERGTILGEVYIQTAATCRGKSYAAPSASLPHVGFSIVDIVTSII
jgi:hypothetical protein